MWKALILILILAAFAVILTIFRIPSNPPTTSTTEIPKIEVIAQNLEVPWALAFLPFDSAQGKPDILVTERVGRVKLISKDGEINEVAEINVEQVIVDKIPGATAHDGGRIKFGPDGFLYITTGDAANSSLSQDKNSLAGKILKVTDDGKVEIYSYGHRNPQGITWDNLGRLWSTEHGASATDEINLIEEGKNYGWPQIRGDQKQQGMVLPILHSGSDTWAPAGAAFLNDSIYFGGLRGQALYQFKVGTSELKTHFKGQFGRIRDVVLGTDNMLYITTSNKDGRGSPASDDDKIIKINPEKL